MEEGFHLMDVKGLSIFIWKNNFLVETTTVNSMRTEIGWRKSLDGVHAMFDFINLPPSSSPPSSLMMTPALHIFDQFRQLG
jgi:hypothetical protein